MEKFLFYEASIADMVCIPAHRLTNIVIVDEETIHMRHRLPDNDTVGTDARYQVVLDINAGTGKKVSESISNAISSGKNPFIIVADDVNKVYSDDDITATVGTLQAIS